MAAERYLSRRIPDSRVGNDIDKKDKKPVPSIYVPDLTQDTNGNVTNSQVDTTNESQEISPFPACDHKAHINRRPQKHSKHKTEKT